MTAIPRWHWQQIRPIAVQFRYTGDYYGIGDPLISPPMCRVSGEYDVAGACVLTTFPRRMSIAVHPVWHYMATFLSAAKCFCRQSCR